MRSAGHHRLDETPVTGAMRERAQLAGVNPRDDRAVRSHHARVSRALAEIRRRDEGAVA